MAGTTITTSGDWTAMTVLSEIWKFLGSELLIFLVTLIVGILLRKTTDRRRSQFSGKSPGCKGVPGRPKVRALSPKTGHSGAHDVKGDAHIDSGVAPRAPEPRESRAASRMAPRLADDTCAEQRQQPFPTAVAANVETRFVKHVFDEAIDGMREQSGTKGAVRALQLYGEFRSGLQNRIARFEGADATGISAQGLAATYFVEAARGARRSSLDLFTGLVQSAIRVGNCHMVECLVDDMILYGVSRPLVFYESAMKQLAGQKQFSLALGMYDRLTKDNLEPSAVTCSCLVSFAAEVGELERAVTLFEKLGRLTRPSIRAYMTILRVHAKRQDWPASVKTLRDMQVRNVALDSLVLNVILATGMSCNRVEDAESLVQEFSTMTPPIADVVSYNTLVKGYAQRNDSVGAAGVLARMRSQCLSPNAISFNTVMDAAVRNMKIDDAWDLLQDMRKSGLRPDKYTCSILVKGSAKGGSATQLRSALGLLREVDRACDATLRATLYASVCEAAAHANDTALLLQTLAQMCAQQVQPSSASFRLLTRALAQENSGDLCEQAWRQLLAGEIVAQPAVFNAVLDSYVRQGKTDCAVRAFESLSTARATPLDHDCLEECSAAFIRSLCRAGKATEATVVYRQAVAHGFRVDSATGHILARILADK